MLYTLQVFKILTENTKDIKGAMVENHKFCTSVHYRNVDENVSYHKLLILLFCIDSCFAYAISSDVFHLRQIWPTVAQCVHDILKDYPRLHLTHGRKVT